LKDTSVYVLLIHIPNRLPTTRPPKAANPYTSLAVTNWLHICIYLVLHKEVLNVN
jgi:hypothetical protein